MVPVTKIMSGLKGYADAYKMKERLCFDRVQLKMRAKTGCYSDTSICGGV